MSCCKNSKPVTVNNGSGFTLKKKSSPIFYQISSKKQFTLNGTSNNQSYIGNPNTAIAYNSCKCIVDKNPKISVKNYSAYLKTRIVNNNLKCSPNISFKCIRNLYNNGDFSFNKHFNNNNLNKDNDSRILI